jgi:hypothetical protein
MCCACGGGTTGGADDGSSDNSDTDDDTSCIDDETTRQACLDQWVNDFQFTPRTCFLNSQTLTHQAANMQTSYAYVLYYGGCSHLSVDVWFDRTPAQWNNLVISSGANMNENSNVSGRKYFNLKTGGIDRVGFRVPRSQLEDWSYTGAEVSYD